MCPDWSCGRLFKRSANLLAGSSPSVQPVWVIRWILWLCQAQVPAKLNEVMNLMATKSKRQAFANRTDGSCWLPTQKASLENWVDESLLSQVRTASLVKELMKLLAEPNHAGQPFEWCEEVDGLPSPSASLTEQSGEVNIVQMKWWSCWLSQVKSQPLEWCEEVIDWAK